MGQINPTFSFPPYHLGLPDRLQGAGILSLTNNQKLSLPPATPGGTQVNVTDWMTVAGAGTAEVNAIYSDRGPSVGGKNYYNILGTIDSSEVSSIVWVDFGAGLSWNIVDAFGSILYRSDEDVATPDLVTVWDVNDGAGPAPTVTTTLQQLNAPSSTVTAMFVGGAGTAEANAIYTGRGMSGGKEYFNILGAPDDSGPLAAVWGDFGSGDGWNITDIDGIVLYFSAEDVATPNLVVTWIAVTGSLPVPTVSPITQGELDAGALPQNAGTTSVNIPMLVTSPSLGFPQYTGFNLPSSSQIVYGQDITGFSIHDPDSNDLYEATGNNGPFPWNQTYAVGGGTGTPPAPTVIRDDVASEANWGPVTP